MYKFVNILKLNGFSPIFQKINEKPQIVNYYEAARGIPNNMILSKMERTLGMCLCKVLRLISLLLLFFFPGIKLRGKGVGEPLAAPSKN